MNEVSTMSAVQVTPTFLRASPIVGRPAAAWPNGVPLTLSVIIVLEYLDGTNGDRRAVIDPPNLVGYRPYPDVTGLSHREYGNRVGLFRMFDSMRARNILPTIAIDALTCRHYPRIVTYCAEAGCDF